MKTLEAPRWVGTKRDVVEEIRVQNAQLHEQMAEALRSHDRRRLVRVLEDRIALTKLHSQIIKEVIVRRSYEPKESK